MASRSSAAMAPAGAADDGAVGGGEDPEGEGIDAELPGEGAVLVDDDGEGELAGVEVGNERVGCGVVDGGGNADQLEVVE